ncbi:MAG: hypothetical protein L0Y54_23625, partial [Sporichthyaceae bacterium]|nr:hypothetical protein [Sporichthyaceae bacterium]
TYLTTKATYDNHGRVVSETDGRGKITNTVYTPSTGRPVDTVQVTNPLGHVSTSWRSAATGAETKSQDANNQVSEYDYDPLGRLIRAWSPTEPRAGGDPSARFTYTLTFDGAVGPVTAPPRVLSETLQSGTTYLPSYTYLDGLGREREVQAPSPTGTGRTITATYYDTRGQVATVSRPFYNSSAAGSGLHNAATSALPTATASVYDSLGREVAVITEASGVEQWRTSTAYRGDRTVLTPPTGGTTETFVNADGDTTKVTEDVGASTADTVYTYTPRGELASIDPPGTGANTISYGYDWAGRQTSSSDPDAGSLASVLDGNGNVTQTTDALGHVIETAYDDLNRPTQRNVTPSGEAKATAATWAYDTGVANAQGRLVTTTAISGGQNYVTAVGGYDGRGRPTSTAITIPTSEGDLAGSYQFSYGYDAAGHQTSLTYPAAGGLAQETVTTGYTAQGAPNSLSGLDPYVTSTTWRGDALLGGKTYGQAGGQPLTRGYTFDTVGRLATITTSRGATLAQDDRYGYDNSGNTTSIHDALAAQRECFGYDDAQRLTSAYTTTAGSCAGYVAGGPDPYNQSWTYTDDGNIATATTTAGTATYSYGPGLPTAGPHAATGVSGGGRSETYSYDQAGQMVSRTVSGVTTSYAWDAQHRLASATVAGSGTTSMVYDADGQRLIRTLPDGSKTLYLPGMELVLSGPSVTASRYYTDGTGAVVAMRTGAGLTWLANSPQASTQIAVDAATGVVSRQRYLPHGGKRGAAVLPTQRGWLGQTADDSTGLVYLNARYYDPNLARFLTPDPIVDMRAPQLSNPYTYAGNNPTTYTDPTGLILMSDGGGPPKKKPSTITKKKSTVGKGKGKTRNYAPIRVPKQKRDMEKRREQRERTRQIIAKRSGKGAGRASSSAGSGSGPSSWSDRGRSAANDIFSVPGAVQGGVGLNAGMWEYAHSTRPGCAVCGDATDALGRVKDPRVSTFAKVSAAGFGGFTSAGGQFLNDLGRDDLSDGQKLARAGVAGAVGAGSAAAAGYIAAGLCATGVGCGLVVAGVTGAGIYAAGSIGVDWVTDHTPIGGWIGDWFG